MTKGFYVCYLIFIVKREVMEGHNKVSYDRITEISRNFIFYYLKESLWAAIILTF